MQMPIGRSPPLMLVPLPGHADGAQPAARPSRRSKHAHARPAAFPAPAGSLRGAALRRGRVLRTRPRASEGLDHLACRSASPTLDGRAVDSTSRSAGFHDTLEWCRRQSRTAVDRVPTRGNVEAYNSLGGRAPAHSGRHGRGSMQLGVQAVELAPRSGPHASNLGLCCCAHTSAVRQLAEFEHGGEAGCGRQLSPGLAAKTRRRAPGIMRAGRLWEEVTVLGQ